MRIRASTAAFVFTLLTACSGGESANDPGPAPGAEHPTQVQAMVDQLLKKDRTLDGSATGFRFAAPVRGEVARWHFDPQIDGQTHELGSMQGWCVDYWYTPEYVGYPEQPERHEMALFADGALRGLFSEGLRNAPLDLDRWHARWVDTSWPALRGEQALSSTNR